MAMGCGPGAFHSSHTPGQCVECHGGWHNRPTLDTSEPNTMHFILIRHCNTSAKKAPEGIESRAYEAALESARTQSQRASARVRGTSVHVTRVSLQRVPRRPCASLPRFGGRLLSPALTQLVDQLAQDEPSPYEVETVEDRVGHEEYHAGDQAVVGACDVERTPRISSAHELVARHTGS